MADVPMRFREGTWVFHDDMKPGDMWRFGRPDGSESKISGYCFSCPCCNELHSFTDPPWTITGSAEDNTLTVKPSLHNLTCGWHGFLTDGVFRG